MNSQWALAVVTLLALGCAASQQSESRVVASGPDLEITLEELDEAIREQLFQDKTHGGDPSLVHQLRSDTLDDLIRDRVLQRASASLDLSVDEFIESQAVEVSDEEIQAFFDENKDRMGGANLEDIRDRLRQFLEGEKRTDAIEAVIEAAGIEVALVPPRFEVEAIGPSRGPADAPITIIEFSDFQCPFCSRATPTINELLERHPEDLRLVYRHLPLESIHPRARPAAIASACADDQGKFWGFHDALFANPGNFADEDFTRIAAEIGVEATAFDTCYANRATEARVDADIEAARATGISGTPAFLINGVMLQGAQPVQVFEKVIANELERLRGATP